MIMILFGELEYLLLVCHYGLDFLHDGDHRSILSSFKGIRLRRKSVMEKAKGGLRMYRMTPNMSCIIGGQLSFE